MTDIRPTYDVWKRVAEIEEQASYHEAQAAGLRARAALLRRTYHPGSDPTAEAKSPAAIVDATLAHQRS